MNILTISASPRKGGNSDTLCDRFMEGAQELGVIYGTSAWEKGGVERLPVTRTAYDMGLHLTD